MCIAVPNFTKIGQTVSEISRFFDFQDGRRPPSGIFEILKIFVSHQVERSVRCIIIPNFIKIG